MHPRILAQREAQAQQRITEAIGTIGQRFGIPYEGIQPTRYPEVNQMLTWEKVADFLTQVATASPGLKLDDVLAVEGLSKTSIRALEKAFEIEPEGSDDDGDPDNV